MSDADQEIEGYVREKSRRAVGWAVLRQLSSLAASIEEEERANARLARRILWSLAVVVPCVLLLGIATIASPKVALVAPLIAGGAVLPAGTHLVSVSAAVLLQRPQLAGAQAGCCGHRFQAGRQRLCAGGRPRAGAGTGPGLDPR